MPTYYVRNDGSSTKDNATNPANASSSMSVSTFNASTFSPGDVIYFSSRGGDITTAITLVSSGSSGAQIIYSGEENYTPTITAAGGLNQNGCSYVTIKQFNYECLQGETGFNFTGSAVGVVTEDLHVDGVSNQAFQHLGTVQVDHYRATSINCGDEGLSMHDSPTVRVFNCSFSGLSGANWVGSGILELYDSVFMSESANRLSIEPAATVYHLTAKNCVFIESIGMSHRGPDFSASGEVFFYNCVFINLGSSDFYLLLRSTLDATRLINCVFYNGSISSSVVFNQRTDGINKNNIFHTTTTGSGKAYYYNYNVDNTVYYASGSTYYGSTYSTADPLFVDPTNGDFHLQGSSPVLSISGFDASSYFTTDIDGDPRINWNIGVDEYTCDIIANVSVGSIYVTQYPALVSGSCEVTASVSSIVLVNYAVENVGNVSVSVGTEEIYVTQYGVAVASNALANGLVVVTFSGVTPCKIIFTN